MRISDWSSDVCSSDLPEIAPTPPDLSGRVGRLCDRRLDRRAAGAGLTCPAAKKKAAFREGRPPLFGSVIAPKGCDLLRFFGRSGSGVSRSSSSVGSRRSSRSEEHTSELQSLMRISYAVFCL